MRERDEDAERRDDKHLHNEHTARLPKPLHSSASAGSLQDFVCAVCLDYIQSPASATCNCNFCVECIHKWLETPTNTNCPTCRAPMASEDVKPNPTFFEKMDPVVTCPHKGCEESLPLSKLKEHAKGCSFLPLKCKYSR